MRTACPWCLSTQATLARADTGYAYRCDLCFACGPLAATRKLALELWNQGLEDHRAAPLRLLYDALSTLHRLGACGNPEDCQTPGCTHIAARLHTFLLNATSQPGAATLADMARSRTARLIAEVRQPDNADTRKQAAEAEAEYARIAPHLGSAGITVDDFVRWRLAPHNHHMGRAPEIQDFIGEVASHSGYTRACLLSHQRQADVTFYRHVAIWLARTYGRASITLLGRTFSRNPYAITSAIERIEREQQDKPEIRSLLTILGIRACYRAFAPSPS